MRTGRRAPRLAPRRWWRPTARDGVVVAGLVVWAVIGSQTSDDGYILGIARARESAGYIGNYYRWFNVPEAPFGWFYELYSVWIQVSDNVLWMRLPSVFMGIVSWMLISREMLPRLGQQVRTSKAAGWAAAMVFLMFWLPFNNGLRPEPVAVISALLAFCAVERAVATRRLAPVALGLVAAAFALAATPTGLMAVAPFLAAARPLFRLVQQRVRRLGLAAGPAPDPGVRPDRAHRDLRRPDLRRGDGGQPGPVPHRARTTPGTRRSSGTSRCSRSRRTARSSGEPRCCC